MIARTALRALVGAYTRAPIIVDDMPPAEVDEALDALDRLVAIERAESRRAARAVIRRRRVLATLSQGA